MSFYRRNLPHWQPEQAEYFVTFRLTNSLPAIAIERLNDERKILQKSGKSISEVKRRIFAKYENLLDKAESGPTWLKNRKVAQIVCESIHHRDQNEYDLYAYCVMPNHIHLVFKLLNNSKIIEGVKYPVTKLLQGLKKYTAHECNKVLDRTGQFWQHESFDRVVRDTDELENTIRYVLHNPVKAKLVKYWKDWPYSCCKEEFVENFL